MNLNFKGIFSIIVFIAFSITCRAQSAQPDERALWNVWLAGTNSAFEAAAVVEACKEFKTGAPKDPLTVVVSGFEAWHYLKKGNTKAAVAIFNSMLVKGTATDLQKAGDLMARSWLTRLDREQVVSALKMIYRRDIEFPATLEALNSLKLTPAPPLMDRWGKPWEYRLDSKIKGMESQRYILESATLGAYSRLDRALKEPYADGLQLKPVQMVKTARNVVEFETSNGLLIKRQAGDQSNRINLVYLGANIVVLSDGNHWCVLPKPR